MVIFKKVLKNTQISLDLPTNKAISCFKTRNPPYHELEGQVDLMPVNSSQIGHRSPHFVNTDFSEQ